MTKFESLPEPCPDARLAPATSGVEPSALADLLARVEGATGPDRQLDGHLYGALGFQIIQRFGGFEWRPEGKGIWQTMPSPTASLDAALALVTRVLPGWVVKLNIYPAPYENSARIYERPERDFSGRAPPPPSLSYPLC